MAKSIFLFVLNHNPANLKSPKSISTKRFTSTLYSCTFQFFRPIFVCTAQSRGTSARHTSRSRSTIAQVLLSSFRFQYRSRSDSTICEKNNWKVKSKTFKQIDGCFQIQKPNFDNYSQTYTKRSPYKFV